MKWGDLEEGEEPDVLANKLTEEKEGGLSQASVQVFENGPDENGIKTITEFRTTEEGKKTKTIRKVKVQKKAIKVNRNVIFRRKLPKFGDCKGVPPGAELNVTYQTHENFKLNLKCKKREDKDDEEDDPLAKLKGAGTGSIVVCRHCGESGHWSLKCPQRDTIEVKTKSMPNSGGGGAVAPIVGGKYVPVHLRGGGTSASASSRGGAGGRFEDDSANTIRVTNISEDTTEDDLRDLFRSFGHTLRIYLAKDRQTHVSRGFAFITYADRPSAEDAITNLNGYGYDNLILRVEFAKAREDKPKEETPDANGAGFGNKSWTMRGTS